MPSAILNLVKLNENIDYTFVIPLVILYFLTFWLIVSIWVYTDTKKRIKRKRFRFLIFLLNLIFGLPFMLLYLLARPYDNEEADEISGGGINVPVINFVGKEGVMMALELKISPTSLIDREVIYDANMRIGVNIETPQSIEAQKIESLQIKNKEITGVGKSKKKGFIQFVKNIFEFKGEESSIESSPKEVVTKMKEENKNFLTKQNKKSNKRRNR